MGELDFQMALGSPLIATRGWGASEVEASYGRAVELCEGMGYTSPCASGFSAILTKPSNRPEPP